MQGSAFFKRVIQIGAYILLLALLPANAPVPSNPPPLAVANAVFLPLVTRDLREIEIGAFVGVSPPTVAAVTAFETLTGRHLRSVLWYQGWSAADRPAFPGAGLNSVRDHDGYDTGLVEHLTWEPWAPLASIAGGAYDAYLSAYAGQVKNWGGPLRLRFGHEMIQNNVLDGGEWYPWQDQPAEYKAAFRHVHDVFQAAGAANVEFVFCPQNYPSDLNIVQQYYPGPEYVDWLCMDGYNSASPWQWFDDIFYNLYHTFIDHPDVFGGKPVMLGEFSSCEATPANNPWETKSAWIQNAFERIKSPDYSHLNAFYWFHAEKDCGWRVDTSPASLAAFKSAISDPLFISHP